MSGFFYSTDSLALTAIGYLLCIRVTVTLFPRIFSNCENGKLAKKPLMTTTKLLSLLMCFFFFVSGPLKSSAQPGNDSVVVSRNYVLQVVFVGFKAYSSESGNIIEWSTILEANLARYEIERSIDNKPFEKIGDMKAKGVQSSVTSVYSFTDPMPAVGKNIYRLKMIDTKNGFKYSANKTVSSVGHVLYNTDFHTYPNPAKPGDAIHIFVKEKGQYTMQVFNLTGKMVFAVNASGGGTGGLTVNLPSQLGKGLYFFRLTQPQSAQMLQQKILVL